VILPTYYSIEISTDKSSASLAFAAPPNIDITPYPLSVDDTPPQEAVNYCSKWYDSISMQTTCLAQGYSFCEGKFVGNELDACHEALQKPYCRQFAGSRENRDCNTNPNYCDKYERGREYDFCVTARGGTPQNDFCDMMMGTQNRQCISQGTGYCDLFLGESKHDVCCDQKRFTSSEKRQCKATRRPQPPQNSPPSTPQWCSFIYIPSYCDGK
jgi:hypothetical protein